MKPNLLEIDKAFTEQYRSLFEIQQKIQSQLSSYEFDLEKTEITEAIIERMLAFWYFHVNNNKVILDREINTTAADFFTETCLFFLKSYFKNTKGFEVCSEKTIIDNSKIRPDISIWKADKLIAVIELKVSNGWKGKFILPHLEEREKIIKEHHPNIYFGVLAFWNFFDNHDPKWNKNYFGLLQYDPQNNHKRTNASVEGMIRMVNEVIYL
jgi:hypothetical protein